MTFEKQWEYEERQERLAKSFEVMDEYETLAKHEAELRAAEAARKLLVDSTDDQKGEQ